MGKSTIRFSAAAELLFRLFAFAFAAEDVGIATAPPHPTGALAWNRDGVGGRHASTPNPAPDAKDAVTLVRRGNDDQS
jgi:hypothetical protein